MPGKMVTNINKLEKHFREIQGEINLKTKTKLVKENVVIDQFNNQCQVQLGIVEERMNEMEESMEDVPRGPQNIFKM